MDILIVEDSATLRANMASVLSGMGHRVHLAESGEKCLHLIESCLVDPLYDLILMDVEMPGLNGFETTRLVRETLAHHWIPIIFVTGVSDEASFEKGIEAGGDDYLAKPVSNVVLKAKIKAMERISDMQREMARLNRELKATSEKDSLTQLLNRRAFNARADQLWQKDRRQGGTSAVIMVDVDYFKQFNDAYGHIEGDKCLQQIGAALRSVLVDDDQLAARYGGEEFIVFCSNTSTDKIESTGAAIQRAIAALGIEHVASPEKVLTASIGVALSHSLNNHTLAQLIAVADKQLYYAKNTGRNRISVGAMDSHKTILISVSEQDDLQFLSSIFSNKGNIITAESGRECLEIARYIEPDIIVIGSGVRGENGACACDDLKNHEATAGIPVLLLTENTSSRHHPCDDCGATAVDLYNISTAMDKFIL
jgi:diguanylate cyclase (GGDEF)-like protein